jgi:hypothetical protein
MEESGGRVAAGTREFFDEGAKLREQNPRSETRLVQCNVVESKERVGRDIREVPCTIEVVLLNEISTRSADPR